MPFKAWNIQLQGKRFELVLCWKMKNWEVQVWEKLDREMIERKKGVREISFMGCEGFRERRNKKEGFWVCMRKIENKIM